MLVLGHCTLDFEEKQSKEDKIQNYTKTKYNRSKTNGQTQSIGRIFVKSEQKMPLQKSSKPLDICSKSPSTEGQTNKRHFHFRKCFAQSMLLIVVLFSLLKPPCIAPQVRRQLKNTPYRIGKITISKSKPSRLSNYLDRALLMI